MMDREQIAIMIRDIERYLSDLSEMDISKKEDFEEKESYYAVSMIIFAVMNRVADLGNAVISGSKIPMPDTYREVFVILSKNSIISNYLASRMINFMKFRNAIANEYYRITNEEMFRLKDDIYEVEKFIDAIKKYVEKK